MSRLRFSEWRQETVVIKSGQNYDHVFLDTKPNVFFIQNLNNSTLYLSLSRTPTVNEHEFEIKPMKSDAFGRPLPCGRLYILNASKNDVTVTIFSTYQEFDIGLLKDLSVDLSGLSFGYDGVITGVKTGVTLPVSFPESSELSVTNPYLTTINTWLQNLYNKINNGWTNGTFVEKNSSGILSKITDILTKLSDSINVNITVPESDIYTGEYVDSTGTITIQSDSNSIITLISNDGETDIKLTFIKDSVSKTLTLKAGEILENLYVNTYSIQISPKYADTAISYRYLITNRY